MSQFNLYLERVQEQKYNFLFEAGSEDFNDKLFNFIGAMIFAGNVVLGITLADWIHYNRIEPKREELKQKVVEWFNNQKNKEKIKIKKDIEKIDQTNEEDKIKEIDKIKEKYSDFTSQIIK